MPGVNSLNISESTFALDSTTSSSLCSFAFWSPVKLAPPEPDTSPTAAGLGGNDCGGGTTCLRGEVPTGAPVGGGPLCGDLGSLATVCNIRKIEAV